MGGRVARAWTDTTLFWRPPFNTNTHFACCAPRTDQKGKDLLPAVTCILWRGVKYAKLSSSSHLSPFSPHTAVTIGLSHGPMQGPFCNPRRPHDTCQHHSLRADTPWNFNLLTMTIFSGFTSTQPNDTSPTNFYIPLANPRSLLDPAAAAYDVLDSSRGSDHPHHPLTTPARHPSSSLVDLCVAKSYSPQQCPAALRKSLLHNNQLFLRGAACFTCPACTPSRAHYCSSLPLLGFP